MEGYVIVYTHNRSKRVRTIDDKGRAVLCPFFKYPSQALNYIIKRLNNSSAVTLKKVGGKNEHNSSGK